MKTVVTPEQMRMIEKHIIESQRVPSLLLMDNAGRYVAGEAGRGRVLVVCGSGNNGGDGYSAARHIAMRGGEPIVWAIGGPPKREGDARTCYEALIGSGVAVRDVGDAMALSKRIDKLRNIDCVVDALFGIGLNREVTGLMRAAINAVNVLGTRVVSVDAPSGLDCATGEPLGAAVRADVTVTFQYAKLGHYLKKGREYVGEIKVAPIASLTGYKLPECELMEPEDLQRLIPPRPFDANKGSFGRALIAAGSPGMTGAAMLCARAALRTGTGLLTIAAPPGVAEAVWPAIPEVMAHTCSGPDKLSELLDGKTCAAVGPGMGKGGDVPDRVRAVLGRPIPVVVDADGLNALAGRAEALARRGAPTVLTPHPVEMSRLCGATKEEVLAAPVECAAGLAVRSGAVVVLKGATSVIAAPDGRVSLNISGGPMLAKGGSGDVLTGIVLGLLSQGLEAYDAARVGTLALGLAAQRVKKAEQSVIASDIIENLFVV